MGALHEEREYTIDDIYALPEGQRAELIDGDLFMMAPPSPQHQKLVMELSYAVMRHIKEGHGPCQVNIAPYAVFLNEDDQNYVEPDVFVVCDPDKISDRGCEGAPDWIIEILSPTSEKYDLGVKLFKYRSAGVKEYWAVSPMKRIVNVFTFKNNPEGMVYSFDEDIPVFIYPGFSIRISELL